MIYPLFRAFCVALLLTLVLFSLTAKAQTATQCVATARDALRTGQGHNISSMIWARKSVAALPLITGVPARAPAIEAPNSPRAVNFGCADMSEVSLRLNPGVKINPGVRLLKPPDAGGIIRAQRTRHDLGCRAAGGAGLERANDRL